jgi:hypothetical protein
MKMMQTCQEMIWISDLSSTTCMREKGHKGGHNIKNEDPKKGTTFVEDECCNVRAVEKKVGNDETR